MSTTDAASTDESDREEERLQHCRGDSFGETIQRPCEQCEEGWLWTIDSELVCDHCHMTMLRTPGDSVTTQQLDQRRQKRWSQQYSRDEYDSGYARLIGGYVDAYVAGEDGNRQYSIDEYDTVSDGLWTPHLRD